MTIVIQPETVENWPLEKHTGVTSKLLVDGQNMTVLMSQWEPGATALEHTHPHEQVGVCLQGQIELIVDGQQVLVNAGEFYHIAPNFPHAERNIGQELTVLTDFFSPVRSDLLQRHFEPK